VALRSGSSGRIAEEHPAFPIRFVDAAAACAVLAAVAMLTYGRSLTPAYARLDDYGVVYWSRQGDSDSLRGLWFDGGRIAGGWIATIVFAPVNSVEDLRYVRILAVLVVAVGSALTAAMALAILDPTRRVESFLLALCVGLVSLATTATPSAVTWAVLTPGLFAFPLAMGAGVAAILAWNSHRTNWWLLPGLMLLATAFTYQHYVPLAMLPVLLFSAHEWANHRPAKIARVAAVAGMGVASLLAEVAVLAGRPGADRVSDAGVKERLTWFLEEFVPRTIDATVPWSWATAAISGGVVILCLASPLLVGPRYLALSGAVLLGWLSVSVAVLPADLWASYRLIAPAQIALWAGAATCLAFSLSRIRVRLQIPAVAALGGVLLGSLAVSGTRAYDYAARPNVVDWAAVRCLVTRDGPLRPGMTIELNDWTATTSKVATYDEYGVIASSVPWALAYSAWLAQAEVYGADPEHEPSAISIRLRGYAQPGDLPVPPRGCR
jgi:hypothetical protein